MEMVLSLFPGADLLGKSFEREGRCIVRGPDMLTGGDVRDFHVPNDVFRGLIGGPPCLAYSRASYMQPAAIRAEHIDFIPDFVRLWEEAGRPWVVMENVPEAAAKCKTIPEEWNCVVFRDWDCGGETKRTRAFWTWPFSVPLPEMREGVPSPPVVASGYRADRFGFMGFATAEFLPGNTPMEELGRLQGFPELAAYYKRVAIPNRFVWRLLGNGVPRAMGSYVAQCLNEWQQCPV